MATVPVISSNLVVFHQPPCLIASSSTKIRFFSPFFSLCLCLRFLALQTKWSNDYFFSFVVSWNAFAVHRTILTWMFHLLTPIYLHELYRNRTFYHQNEIDFRDKKRKKLIKIERRKSYIIIVWIVKNTKYSNDSGNVKSHLLLVSHKVIFTQSRCSVS